MSFLPAIASALASSPYFVPGASIIAVGAGALGVWQAYDTVDCLKRYGLAFATIVATCGLTQQAREWNHCTLSSTDWSCETINVVHVGAVIFGTSCCVAMAGKATLNAICRRPSFIERVSTSSAQSSAQSSAKSSQSAQSLKFW